MLWFAFKLVSLTYWKQLRSRITINVTVVICFQISIFDLLKTTRRGRGTTNDMLWFAFKLVSLTYWKQLKNGCQIIDSVVICFQISIFDLLKTTPWWNILRHFSLWFAFKLVSLTYWKQLNKSRSITKNSCDLLSN